MAALLLEYAVVRNNWGSALDAGGQAEAASVQYADALELYADLEATGSVENVREDIANTMNSLGINCYLRGELEQSRGHLEKALAIRRAILGPDVRLLACLAWCWTPFSSPLTSPLLSRCRIWTWPTP